MRYNMRYAGMTFAEASQARREEKAARAGINAARKARKLAESMTCQCCGRAIFAQSGTIAHHGYERPGYGWQTQSCMGAKHLPFEVSRDRLGVLIDLLEQRKVRLLDARRDVADEHAPVSITYTNRHATPTIVGQGYGAKREYPTMTLEFTRATFAAVLAANTGPHGSGQLWDGYEAICLEQRGFGGLLRDDLKRRDDLITQVRDHLDECHARFKAWKQTFVRFDKPSKTWVAK